MKDSGKYKELESVKSMLEKALSTISQCLSMGDESEMDSAPEDESTSEDMQEDSLEDGSESEDSGEGKVSSSSDPEKDKKKMLIIALAKKRKK